MPYIRCSEYAVIIFQGIIINAVGNNCYNISGTFLVYPSSVARLSYVIVILIAKINNRLLRQHIFPSFHGVKKRELHMTVLLIVFFGYRYFFIFFSQQAIEENRTGVNI